MPSVEISSTLRLQDGHWQGFIASDGGADVPAQAGNYTLEGDKIVMIELPARYVYRWSIDEQDRLHIKVVSIENAGLGTRASTTRPSSSHCTNRSRSSGSGEDDGRP